MRLERLFYYGVVFLSGAAVLVVELISARLLSPFYGTSLAVWTAVISVTLADLAIGYIIGGWLGDRLVAHQRGLVGLSCILGVAATGCGLTPLIAPFIMSAMQPLGLVSGVLVSAAVLLSAPLMALGMVGPYVIRIFVHHIEEAGRVAGRIFALSTAGSILAALATGLVLAPLLGVRASYMLTAIVLAILAVIPLPMARRSFAPVAAAIGVLALTIAPGVMTLRRPLPVTINDFRIVQIDDRSSYGQIKIIEHTTPTGPQRWLLYDGIYQSGIDLEHGGSSLPYVHVIAAGLSVLPPDAKIVVIGAGGGVLPTLLDHMGYHVTVVDIDPRMARIARQWFDMPESVDSVVADGRQYIQSLPAESVDAIVLDASTGDSQPVHLLTREAFEACRRALRPTGFLTVNLLMFTQGERGLAYAGMIQTLEAAGFDPQAVGTMSQEAYRNVLVFAHPGTAAWNKAFGRASLLKLGVELGGMILRDFYIAAQNPIEPRPLEFVPIYTDDCSALEYLNQAFGHGLRRSVIQQVSPAVIFY